MKKNVKYLFIAVLGLSALFYSCETVQLENLVSPNGLSPDQADADFLFNNIQSQYRNSITNFNNNSASLARIDYMFGKNYFNNFGSGTVQTPWTNLYTGIIPDITALESKNSPETNLSYQIGVSKIMQAHIMMLLVDYLGDIVYEQANNPGEFPTPALDEDATVYTAALSILDEAISYLSSIAPSDVSQNALDFFYGGSSGNDFKPSQWIKVANTLKMRADLTMGNYANVLAATNVISSTEDDLQYTYGTNQLSPDNRHPDYAADYTSGGANIYQSNWLMSIMVSANGDLDAAGSTDPRRRYYFLRQNWNTPNNYAFITDIEGRFGAPGAIYIHDEPENAETLECSGLTTPTHLEFTPDENIWCSLPLGYWGRSHGNDEGTPPDNFTRTAVGVYPAGGSFDGNPDAADFIAQFDEDGDYIGYVASTQKLWGQAVGLGKGGGGAGIEPIILASYVEFWKAEANLMLGNVGPAATNIENALTMSIAKVQSFISLDGSARTTEVPDAATVTAFINRIKTEFENAAISTNVDGNGFPLAKDKMDILSEQFFVTMFGGAADAFNFIRRTGYPRTMARSWEPNPGDFPRTVLYPGNEVGSNPNISQRTDLSTRVFWDQGVTSPAN